MKNTICIAVLPVLIASLAVAAGCSSNSPDCLPEPITASPSSVQAGSTVTLSAPPAACDPGSDDRWQYTVLLMSEAQDEPARELLEIPAHLDGSFTGRVEIPAGYPISTATLLLEGGPWEPCDDLASCAAYSVTVTIE